MKLSRAVKFLGTAAVGLSLAAFTGLTVKTWAYMFIPWKTAVLAGVVAALVPGIVLNKMLTNSYRQFESDAHEVGSFFGILMAVNLAVIPAIYLGLGGGAGTLAAKDAAREAAVTLELIEKDGEATLETFPASETGSGYVWVENIGDAARPRIIAREADGRLRAHYLPPRGDYFGKAAHGALVGPADAEKGLVMLVPTPEPGHNRTVDVSWSGGQARFEMNGGDRRVTFDDR